MARLLMGFKTDDAKALWWHIGDVVLIAVALGWATYGLWGNRWLQRRRDALA